MDRLVSILLLKGKFPSNKTSEDPDQSKTHILEYFTCPQSNFISTLKKTRLWYILAVNFDNIQTLNRYRQIVDRNKNHPYKPRKTEGPWLPVNHQSGLQRNTSSKSSYIFLIHQNVPKIMSFHLRYIMVKRFWSYEGRKLGHSALADLPL